MYEQKSKHIKNTACPKCRENGNDRAGDNFAEYYDGSGYCWNCGHYRLADNAISQFLSKRDRNTIKPLPKIMLPDDCTIDYPEITISWMEQYQLNKMDMLSNNILWSGQESRLIFPYWIAGILEGWQGRYFGTDKTKAKWYSRGDMQKIYYILPYNEKDGHAKNDASRLVLVEDVVSAIKIGKLGIHAMPIFGTNIKARWQQLKLLNYQEYIIFLDPDMHLKSLKESKEGALKGIKTRVILSEKDPKEYSYIELKEVSQ